MLLIHKILKSAREGEFVLTQQNFNELATAVDALDALELMRPATDSGIRGHYVITEMGERVLNMLNLERPITANDELTRT